MMYVPDQDGSRFYGVGDWQLLSVLGKGSFATGTVAAGVFCCTCMVDLCIAIQFFLDVAVVASLAVKCFACL